MNAAEYSERDATALAALVRGGEVSAAEVHEAAIAAIATVDAKLNAVADGPWERPLEYVAAGPFGAVPFALKDIGAHAAGVPIRLGSRLTGAGISGEEDSYLIKKFRDAGLAMTAVTTTPEFGFSLSTEALVYGEPTRNPWAPSRSAGGSSGGAAALVAAGGVPIAHASDGAGSIRVPAAFNGLVGLKPSRGRVSQGPDVQETPEGFSAEFVVTRTMRDCAGALDVVAGAMPGDKFIVAPPDRPWLEEVGTEPRRLRIAIQTEAWSGLPVDPEVIAVVEAVGRALEEMGHRVEPATLRFDWEAFIEAQIVIWGSGIADAVQALARETGIEPSSESLEAATLSAYEGWSDTTLSELGEPRNTINRVVRAAGEFFTNWDLLLTPTANVPPFPLGYLDANDPSLDVAAWVRRKNDLCSFMPLFNWTGTPAITLPLGHSSEGLPIGVQLAAPMCDEATLIAVGADLERAMPWIERRPQVHAARADGDLL